MARKVKVILNLQAEIDVTFEEGQDLKELARRRLDAFREATELSCNWGILLTEKSGG